MRCTVAAPWTCKRAGGAGRGVGGNCWSARPPCCALAYRLQSWDAPCLPPLHAQSAWRPAAPLDNACSCLVRIGRLQSILPAESFIALQVMEHLPT